MLAGFSTILEVQVEGSVAETPKSFETPRDWPHVTVSPASALSLCHVR